MYSENTWNRTKVYKFDTAGAGEVSDKIDSRAKIIYGNLGIDQNTGDIYFGYVRELVRLPNCKWYRKKW